MNDIVNVKHKHFCKFYNQIVECLLSIPGKHPQQSRKN